MCLVEPVSLAHIHPCSSGGMRECCGANPSRTLPNSFHTLKCFCAPCLCQSPHLAAHILQICSPSTTQLVFMQLAVEATFLEAALQVVEPAAEMLPDNQTRAVEKLAFDWILNTERYVGAQYPELHKARDKVMRCDMT